MYLCIIYIYISYNEIHSLYILNKGWSPIVTASWECKVFHSFGEPRLQIYRLLHNFSLSSPHKSSTLTSLTVETHSS